MTITPNVEESIKLAQQPSIRFNDCSMIELATVDSRIEELHKILNVTSMGNVFLAPSRYTIDKNDPEFIKKSEALKELYQLLVKRASIHGMTIKEDKANEVISKKRRVTPELLSMFEPSKTIKVYIFEFSKIELEDLDKCVTKLELASKIFKNYVPSTFEEEFLLASKTVGIEQIPLLNEDELNYNRVSKGKVMVALSSPEFEDFLNSGFKLGFRQHSSGSDEVWHKIDLHFSSQSSILYVTS